MWTYCASEPEGEGGVHCEDNSVLVESGVLSPEGNLQSTCEDFEGVSDLTDRCLQLRGLL